MVIINTKRSLNQRLALENYAFADQQPQNIVDPLSHFGFIGFVPSKKGTLGMEQQIFVGKFNEQRKFCSRAMGFPWKTTNFGLYISLFCRCQICRATILSISIQEEVIGKRLNSSNFSWGLHVTPFNEDWRLDKKSALSACGWSPGFRGIDPSYLSHTLDLTHTIPVNDQLLLLFGQLEKQSGRSIAHISGENENMLCVVALALLRTEILLHHTQNLGVVIL